MEDIVAVRVTLADGARRYFLTWGRVLDAVDPGPLEKVVLAASAKFSLGGDPVSAEVCPTLQEAASEPYFFEGFFKLCQTRIPYDAGYDDWVAEKRDLQLQGKDLTFLGRM
jgi:hypothetical protein